jgi:site-specific DNA recombinase
MTYKASKGGTVHRAPLGYLNVKKRVEGRLVSSVVIDEERAPLIRLAFELYATGRYSYKALQEKLTEAGLRTRPNGRYGERPVSIYRLGTMLQDRYYLGYVEWDGIEYEGKHEPLISQELFDRVQRVLLAERRGGNRERTYNHYLKGVVWCDRCKRRLIIMRGKSKSGKLYFYYLCRGRQAHLGCDLPYFSVAKIAKAVAAHYATVRLPQDFCERATTMMDAAVASKQATANQLKGSIEKELAELDIREDRYLDLYGEGDLPKAKLNERLKTVHDDRAKLQRQLDALQGELETGRAILVSAMELLDDPKKLYEEAKTPARKVLNKAIFTKLLIDDLGDGPIVTGDELKEPFATVIYARRAEAGLERDEVQLAALEAIRVAEDASDGAESSEEDTLRWLEAELRDVWARSEGGSLSGLARGLERHRGDLLEETAPDLTGAVLLARSLVGAGSSRTAMVRVMGVEPAWPAWKIGQRSRHRPALMLSCKILGCR